MVNIWCEPYRCKKNEWKKSDRNQCAKKNIKIAAKISPGYNLFPNYIRIFSGILIVYVDLLSDKLIA